MYIIKCHGCTEYDERERAYNGESARSIGERASEHLIKYEESEQNSMFNKRMLEQRDSVPQEVNAEKVKMSLDDGMLRQVTAAVLISKLSPTLNTKKE